MHLSDHSLSLSVRAREIDVTSKFYPRVENGDGIIHGLVRIGFQIGNKNTAVSVRAQTADEKSNAKQLPMARITDLCSIQIENMDGVQL